MTEPLDPNTMMEKLNAGEITPDEAADSFRAWLRSRPGHDENAGKPFDQQERRMIMGVPVVEMDFGVDPEIEFLPWRK